MENHAVNYEDHTINFILIRKKVKNVNLKVRADSTVVVTANRAVPLVFIEELIGEKAPWILKNLKRFAEIKAVEHNRRFVSGEILYYLGHPHSLQVFQATKKEKVVLDNGRITLFVRDSSDSSDRAKLIQNWYKEEGRTVFKQSIERIHPLVAGYGIVKPSITVRSMKTRWGSCSWNRQKITINSELIRAPASCIDYVVLHELAHFRHKKHDASFYSFMSEHMPDWKERKKLLKTIAIGTL